MIHNIMNAGADYYSRYFTAYSGGENNILKFTKEFL